MSAAERYQVVVHVTAETLAGDESGRCELDNGQALALDTVRRNRETGEVIDTSSWIIAGDTLDYGMAIEGLMWKRDRASSICNTTR